jgi:NADH-quinone oxidoreductase subunit H
VSALAAVVHPLLATTGDPLYSGGVGWVVFLIVLIKVLVVFGALMVSVMLMIWFERKVISDMQSRIGPNRAGPFGIAQTMADGIKLFFKEDLLPDQADAVVFKLAPYLTIIPAFLSFAIVPIGGEVTIAGHHFELQLADPPMGILFLLAMSSIGVYGIMLAGWSSGSKYPLLGSVRASAQMISYEAALGMTVVTVVLITGALSTRTIVDAQAGHLWQWNVIRLGVVPFFIFFIAIVAETNRPPFDLVEADSELVGGFVTEYSSIRFALFFLAEFMNTITMSAITVTLFFGGPDGPIPHIPHLYWLWPILWFLGKTIIFPPPLRPAHGSGLEAPDPPVVGVAPHRGRLRDRRLVGPGHGRRRGGRRPHHLGGLLHRRRARRGPGHHPAGRRPPVDPSPRAGPPGRPGGPVEPRR